MQIETWPIESVKPYDNNPRDNDGAVEAVARSLQEFGWRQPIVVDPEHVIVVGHTRWKAAKKLGLSKVPVHVATDLSDEQIRAYRIADNKTAEIATWDKELLPFELGQLKEVGYDLSLLGFTPDELVKVMGGDVADGLCDPDEVPAPPDEAKTRPGDLWILGNHRLLCGDSSQLEDLERLLDGQPVHLVNCDPPYNVNVESRSNNAIAAGLSSFPSAKGRGDSTGRQKLRAKERRLANDCMSESEYDGMLDAWFGNIASVLLPGRGFYIWGGYANCGNYPPALKANGLYFSQAIIWHKMHPVLSRKDFMGAHEWCFYGWREGAAHRFYGPNNATDLWQVKKIPPQQMEHLTAKPAELAVRAITYSTIPGEHVLDLFGGSGSTLIGAEQAGRKAFLMELDPLYCEVIADRFQRFTGTPAILERTGNSPIAMKVREENMR